MNLILFFNSSPVSSIFFCYQSWDVTPCQRVSIILLCNFIFCSWIFVPSIIITPICNNSFVVAFWVEHNYCLNCLAAVWKTMGRAWFLLPDICGANFPFGKYFQLGQMCVLPNVPSLCLFLTKFSLHISVRTSSSLSYSRNSCVSWI